MNIVYRKPLAVALVAVYGGIALLGHGLHWLTPEAGHHHGFELVQCAVHGSAHDYHHHHDGAAGHDHHHHHDATSCEQPHSDELSITAGDCVAHSHQCEICIFLAQARSEQPQLAAAIVQSHFVSNLAAVEQRSYSPTSLCWHTPRGPPRIG